jgi:hypothetical protein
MKLSRVRLAGAVALAVILAACAAGPSAMAAPSRDWKKHPAIVQLDTAQDIFAIGDPHGDLRRLVAALAGAKLIGDTSAAPDRVQWTGGHAVLVITGDMVDKGPASLPVVVLVQTLQHSAQAAGGRVIVTMGNHEAEFLANPEGKKSAEFSGELKAAGLDPASTAACQGDIGAFLCNLPIGARVDDWFFSHAGNTGGRSIPEIETAIETGYASQGFATPELQDDNSILEARLNKEGPAGLPWFDEGKPTTDAKAVLNRYVAKLGVRHIVQGHQPGEVKFPDGTERKAYRFFQRQGLLFLIDTGMSQGVKGSDSIGGVLRITRPVGILPNASAICPDGKARTLWDVSKTDSATIWCGA